MHQDKFAEHHHKGRKVTAAALGDRFRELFGATEDGSMQWANIPVTEEQKNGQVHVEDTDLLLYELRRSLIGAKREKLPGRTVESMTAIRQEVLGKIKNPGARNQWREEFNSFARELIDSGLIKNLENREFGFKLTDH